MAFSGRFSKFAFRSNPILIFSELSRLLTKFTEVCKTDKDCVTAADLGRNCLFRVYQSAASAVIVLHVLYNEVC